ncbi:major facilitator superfamily domain-containing protein [Aspergillus californicus]
MTNLNGESVFPDAPTDRDQQLHEFDELDPESGKVSESVLPRDEESQASTEGTRTWPALPDRSVYVIDFDGPNDPSHPHNWPLKTKLYLSAMLGLVCFSSTFDSAIFSPSTAQVAEHFGVSQEVAILTSSLYIVGFACGPLFWGPLSELYGRRIPIVVSMLGFGIFNTAVAVSKDLQTLLVCRCFSGIFGSCPIVVVAASFADLYNNRQRGIAISLFSDLVFLGPLAAPSIGGFINESFLGWRWTGYIPAFMGYAAFAINLCFLKETYPPVILVAKAAELRRSTQNWGIHAKHEQVEIDFHELVVRNLTRPVLMLCREPLIIAVTAYMSFIYGLLYCFLSAYPTIFQGVHGMSPGIGGLPLFGVAVGLLAGTVYMIYACKEYNAKLAANGSLPPIPEWRLPPVIVGGVLFSIGLFWLGWTGFTNRIHWIVPTLSGLCTGAGLLIIFIQLLNYTIDTYLMYAASALAANAFCRSFMAAAFPLFTRQMFDNMGIQWAGTLLGCIAAALVPIPITFLLYGKILRLKSRFVPAPDA